MERISIAARREMIKKVIDGLCAATGYERKYAISMLNNSKKKRGRKSGPKNIEYTKDVRQALVTIWEAANQICSKRLVPFLPEMIDALERHNHLVLPRLTRKKY